jgi:hypothetical protein
VLDTATSKSVSEGEGDNIPTLSDDRQGAEGKEEEITLTTKSTSADQETPLKEIGLTGGRKIRRRGWKQTPLPMKRRNKTHNTPLETYIHTQPYAPYVNRLCRKCGSPDV